MPNLGFRDTGLRSTDKVTRGWGAITQRIRLENSITPLRENILQLSRSRKQCKEPYRRQLTPSTRRTLKPSVPGNTTERHRSARPLCKHLDTHRDPTLVLTARPPDSARNPTERTEKSIGLSTNDRKPDQPVFLSNGAIEERLSGTTRQLRTDGEDLPPPSPAERVRKIIRCRSDTTVGGKEHSKEKVIKKRGNIKRSESTGGGSKSGESSALQFVGSEEKNALKLKNERLSARPAQSPNRDASRKQSSPHSRCRLTLRRWKKGRGLWTRGCEQSKNESRKKTTSGDTRAARSALRRESFVSEKSQLRSKHSSQSRTWHSPKFDSPIKVEQEGSTSTRGNPTKCTTLSEPEEEPEESKQTILNSSLPQHSVPCTGSAVTADAADLSVSQFQHPGAPKVPFYKKHPEKTRDTQHCRNNGGTALKKADSFPDKSPSRCMSQGRSYKVQRCSSYSEPHSIRAWAPFAATDRLLSSYDCEEERKKAQDRVDLWKKKKLIEQAAEEENESRRHSDVREKRAQQRTSKDRKRNEIYAINEVFHRCDQAHLNKLLKQLGSGCVETAPTNAV